MLRRYSYVSTFYAKGVDDALISVNISHNDPPTMLIVCCYAVLFIIAAAL
jgi:hypothetical protein